MYRFRSVSIACLISLQLANTAQAQWGTDVRLTNDAAGSVLCYNNARCISANGNLIHVVWHDGRDGNTEVYYKRSTDGGTSWGPDTRLTNQSAASEYPSLSTVDLMVHVLWQDGRDGNMEIYYKRSTDEGVNWAPDTQITSTTTSSTSPSVTALGSDVHVALVRTTSLGWFDIFYLRSTDEGVSWSETRLTDNSSYSLFPSVAVSGSDVHIVWQNFRGVGSGPDIYYMQSNDRGASWSQEVRLTNDPAASTYPCVSVAGGAVHVVWMDRRDGFTEEIYYKRSTNGGASWDADVRLTNDANFSKYPSILVSGSIAHVLWEDYGFPNVKVQYKRSTDGGETWGAGAQLSSSDLGNAGFPNVATSGTAVHAVWADSRDFPGGNGEIYYKRNPTGNQVTSVKGARPEIPNEWHLSQNYPNPFNPTTVMSYELRVKSVVRLVVYDLLGRDVATLVNGIQDAGFKSVQWDASSMASGVYFYRLSAGTYVETKRMTLLR